MTRAAFFVCLLLLPLQTSAQDARAIALDYSAPSDCPDGTRFSDEVAARLGSIAFREAAARTARVRVFKDGPEFTAVLELDGQTRSFRSGMCEDLITTMASALATVIDASATRADAPVPDAPTTQGPPRVRVRVMSDTPEMTLHRVGDISVVTRGYSLQGATEICTAPCDAQLEPGSHQFAVSYRAGGPQGVARRFQIDRDSRVDIQFDSRNDERVAGIVTLISSLLTAVVMTSIGGAALEGGGQAVMLTIGGIIGLAGPAVGLPLAFLQDHRDIQVNRFEF